MISHGRLRETEEAYRQELEIHPQSLMSTLGMGYPLLYAGRYDEAIQWYRKALEVDPNFPQAYVDLSIAYRLKHMDKEHVESLLKAAALNGAPPEEIARRMEIFRKEGIDGFRKDELETALARREKGANVSPVTIAGLYNSLGETQAALDWLEKGVEERTFQILTVKAFPGWKNLENQPRYHEVLRRIRLE